MEKAFGKHIYCNDDHILGSTYRYL